MNSHTPYETSNKLAHGAVFLLAVLLLAGLTQFVNQPFSDKAPRYEVTFRH